MPLHSVVYLSTRYPSPHLHLYSEAISLLQPFPLKQHPATFSLQPSELQRSGNVSKHISLTWPDGPLLLRSWFIDFAVEHRFICCATDYTGDIGATEILLIDWMNKMLVTYEMIDMDTQMTGFYNQFDSLWMFSTSYSFNIQRKWMYFGRF